MCMWQWLAMGAHRRQMQTHTWLGGVHFEHPRGPGLPRRPSLGALMSGASASNSMLSTETVSVGVYDRAQINARFSARPLEVGQRMAQVLGALARVKLAGNSDGGATLRAELAALGPVFCKVGQTLATRPDIVGVDISRNLGMILTHCTLRHAPCALHPAPYTTNISHYSFPPHEHTQGNCRTL